MKHKITKLMANTFLSVLFLTLIALPVSSMGAIKVEQNTNVLGAQDSKREAILETKINQYEKLILSQQEEIKNLREIIQNLTEQLNEPVNTPVVETPSETIVEE